MDYELPSEFDLVIVGTGVVESILSAAASRVGKTVLHIDSDNYYGGSWASFNLESIQELESVTKPSISSDAEGIILADGERIIPLGNEKFLIKDVKQAWNLPDEEVCKQDENKEEKKTAPLTKPELLKRARRFNIDLAPKLQYARGDFVELLISSNIARYSEYRSVSRILAYVEDKLEVVPCSRADVFSNSKVSVIEKRILMKLLTTCMEEVEKELTGYDGKTFYEFLQDKKLTPNLIQYVLYSLAMTTEDVSFQEGLDNLKRFLGSLGRFGKTPFLYCLYGSGEIPQAFCRLSAVFGGVYALNQTLSGLIVNSSNDYQGVIVAKQRIKSNFLVTSLEKCPKDFVGDIEPDSFISRAIFITDKSILEGEKENLTFLVIPSEDKKSICNILEAGSQTGTCLDNTFIVHFFMRQNKTPQEDLKQFVDKLLINKEKAPKILWSMYLSVPDSNNLDLGKNAPKNLFICPGPDLDLDYDQSIKKAKAIFTSMYPNDEFLPRAPDPEEIILGDDREDGESSKGFSEDGKEKETSVSQQDASAD